MSEICSNCGTNEGVGCKEHRLPEPSAPLSSAKRFEFDGWIIEIDGEARACYVYLKGVTPDAGVAFTNCGDDDDKVNLDYDGEGNLIGVEILR